jgi:gp178
MNKQELIKKYEKEYETIFGFPVIRLNLILEDLKQLDEPQKVTVPQFVADWYEEHKDDFETSLFCSIDLIPSCYEEGELSDFEEWLVDEHTKPFQTLVNMHQFGYEVEKEKRYEIKLKNTDDYLVKTNNNDYRFYNNIYTSRRKHTRKEIEEAGFGWVFDCPGMEVEEVEG